MPALQGVSPIEGLPSRARSAKRLAVFYAAGALALAASALPGGRRVRTYRSAITREGLDGNRGGFTRNAATTAGLVRCDVAVDQKCRRRSC